MKGASLDWNAARAALDAGLKHLESVATPEAIRESVFRRRAEALARPAADAGAPSDADTIMVFRVRGQLYGLALNHVVEVLRDAPLTPVPGAPSEVAGVIQVRGEIRPVFDLPRVLGLPADGPEPVENIILVRQGGRELGIRTERVEDVRAVEAESRRAAPAGALHCAWTTEDLVIVLDLDSLFEGKV